MKASCEAQNATPEIVNFPSILAKSRATETSDCIREVHTSPKLPSQDSTKNVDKNADEGQEEAKKTARIVKATTTKARRSSDKTNGSNVRQGRRSVRQPPLSEFPQEFYKGVDVELQVPAWTDIYFTVFSSSGQVPVNTIPDAWVPTQRVDGNESGKVHSIEIPDGTTKRDAIQRWKPSNAETQLTPKTLKQIQNTPVGLLDPVTGRVVKIYNSLRNASVAIQLMRSSNKYPEENLFRVLNEKKIHKAAKDPWYCFYGYRFVYISDLMSGKVQFEECTTKGPVGGGEIVKRDMITGRILDQFEDTSSAYTDWKQSVLSSPIFEDDRISLTFDNFESSYLKGQSDVDGLRWETRYTTRKIWSNKDSSERSCNEFSDTE